DGRNARTHGSRRCLFLSTRCIRACAVWRQRRRTLALPAALRPSLLSLRPQTAYCINHSPEGRTFETERFDTLKIRRIFTHSSVFIRPKVDTFNAQR
ncbi:MAG: hypothetical protein PHQ26_09270, partial [Bacteroidales bacterium]|nr:hypothetical protein [Bacteroidales bacterium]